MIIQPALNLLVDAASSKSRAMDAALDAVRLGSTNAVAGAMTDRAEGNEVPSLVDGGLGCTFTATHALFFDVVYACRESNPAASR
jgi:hypothetical protein